MRKTLSDYLIEHGLGTPPQVVEDGKFHYFNAAGDPPRKKKAWYVLTRTGDVSHGAFGHWGRGINEKYSSKRHKEMTEYERKAVSDSKNNAMAKEAELRKKAAERAAFVWAESDKTGTHPYLDKKKIPLIGARIWKDKLVIPVYDDGKLVSLQFISTEEKRFITGGKKKGCYTSVRGKDSTTEHVIICEGWATGVSIFESMRVPVVIAFDAYNLGVVADIIRVKYPDAALTIAADNDTGKEVNTGIREAAKAAKRLGCRYVFPVFPDGSDGSDFNDLFVLYGAQAVRDAFAPKTEIIPDDEYIPEYVTDDEPRAVPVNTDWKMRMVPGKTMSLEYPDFDNKSVMNARLILQNDVATVGCIIYDEFSDTISIVRRPPWDNVKNFEVRELRDTDFVGCQMWLETKGMKVGKNTVADAVMFIAGCNSVNPPFEYMDGLKWDGKPRLDMWLKNCMGSKQAEEYLSLIGSKWMIGAVKRVYEPGCKFDSVLILEGAQGIGKSKVLRELATFGSREYFLDSVGDLKNKDTLMTMQGKLIVELAELASFKKAENEEIKAFITRQTDEYRPPYGRVVNKRARRFVFAGSTNEGENEGYLTDHTGNRRYWPVECCVLNVDAIKKDREQLWAEAVFRYKQGERTWLEDHELMLSEGEQRKREIEDAWLQRIEVIILATGLDGIPVDMIADKLELKARDVNNVARKRIKTCLTHLGYYETRVDGKRVWRKQ